MFLTQVLVKTGLYWPLRKLVLMMRLGGRNTKDVFTDIYRNNRWGNKESVSGPGSTLEQTAVLIEQLPQLLKRLEAKSMLDIPCGDFNWMSKVAMPGVQYTGADIVEELVQRNQQNHASPTRQFLHLNLVSTPLPKVDLVFCRDCLVHLSFKDIASAIDNIKRSGATYLMATTFPGMSSNPDIVTGDFRPVNLQIAPFHFPQALCTLTEQCTEGAGAHSDKAMSIWRVADLP
jgi:SAM-dependent methyltransferase